MVINRYVQTCLLETGFLIVLTILQQIFLKTLKTVIQIYIWDFKISYLIKCCKNFQI